MAIPKWLREDERVRYLFHRDARAGITADFPDWLPDSVQQALTRTGITRLWQHQLEVADLAFHGHHVAVSTGTASGKSLAFLLPILTATIDGGRIGSKPASTGLSPPDSAAPRPLMPIPFSTTSDVRERARANLDLSARGHTALYLAPTKALAHDQWQACRELGLPGWRSCTLDGDSSAAERRYARDLAQYVLTNPDMVHHAILPNHQRWARLLSTLSYVVVDEAHRYRGVFGAHVCGVLRRLRRLAEWYGANPVFIAASATVTDAASLLEKLTGVTDATEVTTDSSARPALDFVLWQPDEDLHHEAATIMARLVADGCQTLCFTSSRVQAELIAVRAERALGAKDVIASYRSGYLAFDRRELERRLQEGSLRGAATTSALELGVNLSGVDTVISCGFPGTKAALWQQAGRAGRADRDALAIFIAKNDPLDAFWCENPDALFHEPLERTVLHPDNPRILGPHLAAAAQELPLTATDEHFFGKDMAQIADQLAATELLRRRRATWYWTRPDRAVASINLRTCGGVTEIIDVATGRIIGVADPATADRTLHEGAIYLHQGISWRVVSYEPQSGPALVVPDDNPYYTQALIDSDVKIISCSRSTTLGSAHVFTGEVRLSSQVTGYLRRDRVSDNVWDSTDLELPTRSFLPQSVWWTVPDDVHNAADLNLHDRAGAAHAAEHAAIGLLPVFAPCDRYDIGGLSTIRHLDTDCLTVFVHDGYPGGAGFAERGYDVIGAWLSATKHRLDTCCCPAGCPQCVVSPKCGSGNNPLDKVAAARLLSLLIN